jgi:hypothetical protein
MDTMEALVTMAQIVLAAGGHTLGHVSAVVSETLWKCARRARFATHGCRTRPAAYVRSIGLV